MAIINRKNISTSGLDEDALTTTTSGEHVLNFGVLRTTGDLANGIFADANNVSVHNFGSIETSGLGAAGIFVQGEDAHVANYGSVVTHGGFFDPNPDVDGDEFFSEGIFVNGDLFSIANYGTVHVEGELSSALVGAGADGTIVNFGLVESLSDESSAVVAIGEGTQAINNGTIIVRGDFTGALFAEGTAINRGQIWVTANEASDGMGGGLPDGAHLTNSGLIHIAANDSFGMLARIGENLQVDNSGQISTEGTFAVGIGTGGVGGHVVNTGHISTEGDLALGVTLGVTRIGFVPSADGTIENRGVIATEGDGAAGVLMAGDGHHLINSGRITADGGVFDSDQLGVSHAAGVLVSGDDALVENTRSGLIESQDAASAAVELNVLERDGVSNADLSSELDNFGLIKGASVAVLGGAGAETVVNHGLIIGDVMLGDGNDTFVFGNGGVLDGELFFGDGDDLVHIEHGSGTSRIADFAAGDVVDVSDFFSSFSQLTAHSSQVGNDVVITLDHKDTVVLEHLQLSTLTASEFLFA